MRRNLVTLGVVLVGMTLAVPSTAQQIHQRSRHSTQAPAFDAKEAEQLLEPGAGSLRGVLKASSKGGLLQRSKSVYADREVVYLLPMTSYLHQFFQQYGRQMDFLNRRRLSPKAKIYTARVFTDRHGAFEFKGLKPGKYFLYATMPYAVDGVIREETGGRRYTIDYLSGTATSSPIYRERDTKIELEHEFNIIVDVHADRPTVLEEQLK